MMKYKFPTERKEKRKMLLEAVEQVRSILAAEVEEAEKLRTLPSATVAALRESGLLALKTPAVLGGAEADPVTQLEVIEAVSYINPSAGWCLFVGAATAGLSGAFLGDSAVAEMFSGELIPTVAGGGGFVAGKLVPAKGGYRLSGRWSFGSGIRHAQWLHVPASVEGEKEPEIRFCVFPASHAEIYDNWYVMGLAGTGSCDYSVDDLFVPEEFVAREPGGAPPKRGGAIYRLGIPAFIANENAGFSLGVARRALDEVIALGRSKTRGYHNRAPLARRGVFQRAIGLGDLRLRAARSLMVELLERAFATVSEGGRLTPQMQAETRAAGALIADVAVEVGADAFHYGAGSALRLESTLQRCLRDLHAAGTHLIIRESSYENVGQFLLGLPEADPMG